MAIAASSGNSGADMNDSTEPWTNTTHDWATTIDAEHLAVVRRDPETFAPGGVTHLILEVLAYAVDEAASVGATGQCRVILPADGSVSVGDNGRGTDTRFDAAGLPVKKPVMASKDLRFFDFPDAQILSDGHPRRGMSVVAALSRWLVHTNCRQNGAWAQRYEYGVPVTDLMPLADRGTTGTIVQFLPADRVRSLGEVEPSALRKLTCDWPQLVVDIIDDAL